jgi:hypothetical protein
MQLIETRTGLKGRAAAIARARASFNPAKPREGRIARQCRRCFLAHDQVAPVRHLLSWCYPAQPRRHWHYGGVYHALRKLGAKRIAWGIYAVVSD